MSSLPAGDSPGRPGVAGVRSVRPSESDRVLARDDRPDAAGTILKRPFFQVVSSVLQRWDKRRQPVSHFYGGHIGAVRTYNAGVSAGKITRTRRAEELYKLLDIKGTDDVLIVGPRDVHELYMAWCYGASWSRITGLDLSSRNPKILVGDMEATAFKDESFDVIVSSATISYVEHMWTCLIEMRRILRHAGALAFTHTYDPESEWVSNRHSPWVVTLWLNDLNFSLRHISVRDKVSTQGRRVEIMTCVVTK